MTSDLLKMVATATERAYRRGYQHGHAAASGLIPGQRRVATDPELVQWRFHVPNDAALLPPGHTGPVMFPTSVERLRVEQGELFEALGSLPRPSPQKRGRAA